MTDTFLRGAIADLRDLTINDLEPIVRYWMDSDPAFLADMGIDLASRGTAADVLTRMSRAIPSINPKQRSVALAITVDDQFAGYTLLNRYSSMENYSHWHITRPGFRRCGISRALYPLRLAAYFNRFQIERLVHQTRTSNLGVNRLLDQFVGVAETRWIEIPDGMALPGEFHLRYVDRGLAHTIAVKTIGSRGVQL